MAELRQAIVLIHGIGEQQPMSTLRSFVETVLAPYEGELGGQPAYYSKPDALDDTFELRRLLAHRPKRTDFYEFYWAHLMPDTKWNRVLSWFWLMMWRGPHNVPRRLMLVWLVSWLAACSMLFLLGRELASLLSGDSIGSWELPTLIAASAGAVATVALSFVGDAATYFGPSPKNIEARRAIRARGLALLSKLNADPRYDRIVVVGHSLGSVIGYDVISLCWQQLLDQWRDSYRAKCDAGETARNDVQHLLAAQDAAVSVPAEFDRAKWTQLTSAVRSEINANGHRWLISDFITLGSPLTHADLLMAKSEAEFTVRKTQRELATSPPTRETQGFTYCHKFVDAGGRRQSIRVPHHAAQFAATAWTNLYFVRTWPLSADLVGGPVGRLFGPGVSDVEVRTSIRFGFLSHTRYWQLPKWPWSNDAPEKLANALRLKPD